MNLKVNPEFRDKIPPLSQDEFSKLEENILADGEVREPLVVWNDTIIDGHHRWKIVQKHPEIPYKVKRMDFPDKYAAIVWMCRNQVGRRNITPEQKTVLIGEAYKAMKKSVGGNRGTGRDETGKFTAGDQNGPLPHSQKTSQKIAKSFNVGEQTVKRAEKFLDGLNAAEDVIPGFKEAVLSGDIKVSKAQVATIKNVPEPERPAVVESILLGDPKEEKKPTRPGRSKEYRALRDGIAKGVAEMYDAENYPEYGIFELVSEIQVNAEAYIRQIRRTAEIRKSIISESGENRQAFIEALDNYVVAEIKKIMEEIRNA